MLCIGSPIRGEVVVLAVYENSIDPIIEQYGEQLSGKVLVNITNPLNASFDGLAFPPDTSSAEERAKITPAGAKVVKAFNTNFAGTLLSGQVAGQPLDVLIAGDDATAKALLADLVQAGGMRPIDVGPLRRATARGAWPAAHHPPADAGYQLDERGQVHWLSGCRLRR